LPEIICASASEIHPVLAGFVEAIEVHYLWRPRLRYPDDDMVLEAAVNGHADTIVTQLGHSTPI
jgi:predicted nucleic acid-binding protein